MKRLGMPVVCALFALVLCACGPGNTVKLLPPPPVAASKLPAPSAASICVVNFKDERKNHAAVGARRDGSAFTTQGDVSSWISRSLADALAQKGFRITFAQDTRQARSSNPDYLVTGVVQEVWLKETSATAMSAQMRVNVTLANRKGKLWTESCNSSQSRTSLPSGGNADDLLLDTLRDLIKPIAEKIQQAAAN